MDAGEPNAWACIWVNRSQLNECFGFEIIAVQSFLYDSIMYGCLMAAPEHIPKPNFLFIFLIHSKCLKENSAKFVSQAILRTTLCSNQIAPQWIHWSMLFAPLFLSKRAKSFSLLSTSSTSSSFCAFPYCKCARLRMVYFTWIFRWKSTTQNFVRLRTFSLLIIFSKEIRQCWAK